MTLVFECVDTVRFQVQEMARVEKILSDEAIQVELDVYNRLLPAEGELSATLFIELTSDASLREWLPRLVGIERRFGALRRRATSWPSLPEAQHAAALTRETVTPAVHYLRFPFTEAPGGGVRDGPTRSRWCPPPRLRGPDGAGTGGERGSCSATCSGQQSLYQSADQGQFCAQVFTGVHGVGHTLRSPEFGDGAVGGCTGRAPEQGECQYPT